MLALAAFAFVLAGCGSRQNTLSPQSPPAKEIASLWWWMMGGAFVGLGVISAMLIAAWFRRGRMGPGREPGEKAGWLVIYIFGVGVMVAGLVALFFVGDVHVLAATEQPKPGTTKLTVRAIGHQWYWEFQYPGTAGAVTADEMHIPVRTPVLLQAQTVDVIHDVWIPQLNRKIDTIPGQDNEIELYADKVGRYRGACNQYCGLQHAHMSFYVFADPPARFRAWLRHQAANAATPHGAAASAGEDVFMHGACSSCHTIRGTQADGTVGPDLTHLGERTAIAGLVLPNHKGDLAAWITDSQHFKPGNQMPDIALGGRKLQQLVAYLEGLK
jgi:cytochrome c oxidase subunit 2